jgi:hypothetical protein
MGYPTGISEVKDLHLPNNVSPCKTSTVAPVVLRGSNGPLFVQPMIPSPNFFFFYKFRGRIIFVVLFGGGESPVSEVCVDVSKYPVPSS